MIAMPVIAVTGGFGTGKTTVSHLLADCGVKVIDVDEIVYELEEPGQPAWQKIVAEFGKTVLNADRSLNRSKLAALVFKDKAALYKLNECVHPEVLVETQKRIQSAKRNFDGLVVVDIPLLFEVNWQKYFDKIVVVTASEKNVLNRIGKNRHLSAIEINQRIQNQLPLSFKKEKADFLVDNDSDIGQTKKQVLTIFQALLDKPKSQD
ncbi:MAG: dephospho-CoA kinase [Candidatus Micrarchaeota archaeon]